VEKDCQARKIEQGIAADRNRWRKLIKEQDRCEWVNVYSGTGRPGYIVADKGPLNGCVYDSVSVCVYIQQDSMRLKF